MVIGLLRKYRSWAIDGTYFCSPKSFYQLFTINVFIVIPHCLASTLYSRISLKKLTRGLFQILHDYDGNIGPESIMADFELAPVNALIDVFGDQLSVNFCLFHLSKNAFAHVQWKQLQPAYNEEAARVLFRSLVALSFLPTKQVEWVSKKSERNC
uniref:MULE transposase domain-containing protein n=1 Tax=Ditylenchus dipsaci TaxID=166011 RepID=A0A915CTG0_9BILA